MDFIDNWQEEKRSAYLYEKLAVKEPEPQYQKLFADLMIMANRQAEIWEKELSKLNRAMPEFRPDTRTRFIAKLLDYFKPYTLRFILSTMKVRGMSIYRQSHLRNEFPAVFDHVDEKHANVNQGSNLRAAVFGMNDGLLTNAGLILGFVGADANPKTILLSGVAGLLAGAFSMGSGEYVSVSSQRKMLEYQLRLEKEELDTYPEEEAAELALIYQARGIPKAEAEHIANLLIQNPEKALDTLAREELGINPEDLGSPVGAAVASFFAFSLGAFIPLAPFLVMHSSATIVVSMVLTCLVLFTVGAVLSLFTNQNAWLGGLKTLLIGLIAGSLTFMLGRLLS
jgi:VIT1/CCC1 family predicted Fe2+/Mn2+ transporter